jgi:predicted carbohydrate-binding protein with CBM5 and CBM33 domain
MKILKKLNGFCVLTLLASLLAMAFSRFKARKHGLIGFTSSRAQKSA